MQLLAEVARGLNAVRAAESSPASRQTAHSPQPYCLLALFRALLQTQLYTPQWEGKGVAQNHDYTVRWSSGLNVSSSNQGSTGPSFSRGLPTQNTFFWGGEAKRISHFE